MSAARVALFNLHDVEVLIFDLGGVLVDFSAFEDLRPLLRTDMQPEQIRQRWITCPHIRDFEVGKLTPHEFAARFVDAWQVSIEADRFVSEFRCWSRGLLPGARAVLKRLRRRYRLAALSNSNAAHWERNRSDLQLFELFDEAFSSHEIGFHKPDRRIYEAALLQLAVRPERTVFFDDSPANVDGARAIGMHAFVTRGVAQLRACLQANALM